jgi:predicted component of type VI protein secretion system
MEIRFLFKSPSGKPRVHTKRLPVVVGRCDSDDVRLRIPIDSVSRRHCEFYFDDASGSVCLRDLDSTNGTLVNGKELAAQASVVIEPGSSVKLGTVVFRVDFKPSRHDPDADTIGIDDASVPPAAATAATVPLPPRDDDDGGDDDAGEPELEPEGDAEMSPAGGGFSFLGAAGSEPAADEAEEPEDDGPPVANDGNLEDFFKGLS